MADWISFIVENFINNTFTFHKNTLVCKMEILIKKKTKRKIHGVSFAFEDFLKKLLIFIVEYFAYFMFKKNRNEISKWNIYVVSTRNIGNLYNIQISVGLLPLHVNGMFFKLNATSTIGKSKAKEFVVDFTLTNTILSSKKPMNIIFCFVFGC